MKEVHMKNQNKDSNSWREFELFLKFSSHHEKIFYNKELFVEPEMTNRNDDPRNPIHFRKYQIYFHAKIHDSGVVWAQFFAQKIV